jgi:predicted transglutaminase-like protease
MGNKVSINPSTSAKVYIAGQKEINQQKPGVCRVAEDIKSEKIREFVYKSEVIVGSEVDANLSAKCLKEAYKKVERLSIKDDCILIGGPVANPLVKRYMDIFSIKITNNYPGKNKGVIQKVEINGHVVVLLAGSDRWGTKAAVEYFKQLNAIPEEPIFVEWRDNKAIKIEKP